MTHANNGAGRGDRTIVLEGARMIPIYIMGKEYLVPETLTILKAVEYSGYQYVRGCGCRGGICGACGTFYRISGDYQLYTGLACQTVVRPHMAIAQMPYFPANRPTYSLEELGTNLHEALRGVFPEIFKCVGCGTCSRTCPMEIDVMDYIALMKRGDLQSAARRSFDCIMCGLCAIRCPAQISQHNAAMFVRRMTGKYLTPRAEHLANRVAEILAGKYEPILAELQALGPEELKKRYVEREREPELSKPGEWRPKETQSL